MIRKFLSLFFGVGNGLSNDTLYPESEFCVEVGDDEIVCLMPDGECEVVSINELQMFEIITNDSGPFAPDVFWVLSTTRGKCVIPHGSSGDSQLLDWAEESLRGFDNEQFIQAMGSTDNNSFLIWSKQHVLTAVDQKTSN